MVTLKEIADKAGVSITTVSNVIHGRLDRVSPAMIKKIEELIKEHNYVPRFGLNALTKRESKIIGVLISTPPFVEETLFEKPFYGIIFGELEEYFRSKGYYIMVISSKEPDEIMRMALGWNIDGLIAVSMTKKIFDTIRNKVKKPIVSIDMDVVSDVEIEDCYNVTSEDKKAGKIMIEHLSGRGCKTVRYYANTDHGADYQRYLGASEEYMKIYHKELPFELIEENIEDRHIQYKKIEKHANKDMALFFSNDLNAVEFIGYIQRRGFQIPKDFSVVGVDDDIYARLSVPSLTTTKIPVRDKAKIAAQMLLDIIDGKEVESNIKITEIKVIERESVINKKNV